MFEDDEYQKLTEKEKEQFDEMVEAEVNYILENQ